MARIVDRSTQNWAKAVWPERLARLAAISGLCRARLIGYVGRTKEKKGKEKMKKIAIHMVA
jgi:hypothetical protein